MAQQCLRGYITSINSSILRTRRRHRHRTIVVGFACPHAAGCVWPLFPVLQQLLPTTTTAAAAAAASRSVCVPERLSILLQYIIITLTPWCRPRNHPITPTTTMCKTVQIEPSAHTHTQTSTETERAMGAFWVNYRFVFFKIFPCTRAR